MHKTLLFFIGIVLFSSCEIINPEETIPSYIYVESFEVETNDDTQGSNSSKITDIWLFNDGDFLGSFPLPATIPILKSGMTPLTLKAGIKDNGISSTPDFYPFYSPVKLTIDLKENHIDTIRPVIHYHENTNFALIEPFEGSTIFDVLRIGDNENRIITDTGDVFEGNKSALVKLDTMHSIVELATNINYENLTKTGKKVYLEVNYKTDVPVFFGLIGYNNLDPMGETLFQHGVSAKDHWNKIYINLSAVAISNHYDSYKVGFQAFIPKEEGKFTLQNAQIKLDNIKLLHF